MITRRDFIKTMSLLSGAVLAPVRWLGKWAGVELVQGEEPPEEGELYAGFVLLPEGAEVPEFVIYPRTALPKFCGVGDSIGPLATSLSFITDTDLANKAYFPIYTIRNPPASLTQKEAYLTLHPHKIFIAQQFVSMKLFQNKKFLNGKFSFGLFQIFHDLIRFGTAILLKLRGLFFL